MVSDKDFNIILRKKMLELIKGSNKKNIRETPLEIKNIKDIEKISQLNLPILIDFWAPWCPPCLFMKPIFENLAKKYSNKLLFVKVNVDDAPDIASMFNIYAVPTFIMLYQGRVICRREGAMPSAIFEKWINSCLNKIS